MKNKELYTLEVVNLMAEIKKILDNEEKAGALPIKFRWELKKTISELMPTVKNFEEFRQELVDELQKEYSGDDKSHVETMEDGTESRKVNDEFLGEYEKRVNELNAKLQEVLTEKNEYTIHTVDMDAFVENLPDDTPLEFNDIEIFSFMGE